MNGYTFTFDHFGSPASIPLREWLDVYSEEWITNGINTQKGSDWLARITPWDEELLNTHVTNPNWDTCPDLIFQIGSGIPLFQIVAGMEQVN